MTDEIMPSQELAQIKIDYCLKTAQIQNVPSFSPCEAFENKNPTSEVDLNITQLERF